VSLPNFRTGNLIRADRETGGIIQAAIQGKTGIQSHAVEIKPWLISHTAPGVYDNLSFKKFLTAMHNSIVSVVLKV
jgi:hypothetical protein